MTHTIDGAVAPGYENVRDAFRDNFTHLGEKGAACAAYVDGRKVVDLWGGEADHTTGRPWTQDTLSLIWSATKGAVGTLVNLLAARGQLDLDEPVARYWPEFARNGKGDITVRMVLDHQAGLPVIEGPRASTSCRRRPARTQRPSRVPSPIRPPWPTARCGRWAPDSGTRR